MYPIVRNEERQEEFRKKLNSLLEEYGVEMEVGTDFSGYYNSTPYVDFYSYKFEDKGDHFLDSGINFKISGGTYGPRFSKI